MKIKRRELLIVVVIAGLLVWFVAGFFEPFSDDQLHQMQTEQTKDLPQNR